MRRSPFTRFDVKQAHDVTPIFLFARYCSLRPSRLLTNDVDDARHSLPQQPLGSSRNGRPSVRDPALSPALVELVAVWLRCLSLLGPASHLSGCAADPDRCLRGLAVGGAGPLVGVLVWISARHSSSTVRRRSPRSLDLVRTLHALAGCRCARGGLAEGVVVRAACRLGADIASKSFLRSERDLTAGLSMVWRERTRARHRTRLAVLRFRRWRGLLRRSVRCRLTRIVSNGPTC